MSRNGESPAEAPETFFERLADRVSWGMGTPTNIGCWLLGVGVWIALGFCLPSLWTTSSFLPSWFTSTAWNFPLNTVTTLAELYIGFLVAAAANRSERNQRAMLSRIETVEDRLVDLLAENTALTQEIHEHVVTK